jgi:hypothetical protein
MTLYDTDFYAWTQEQATLLREGAVADLDLEHVAEEIEGEQGDPGVTPPSGSRRP